MAYRTFDQVYLPEETTQREDDGLNFFRGIINGIIPSLLGWLLIWGMGYVAWCLLP